MKTDLLRIPLLRRALVSRWPQLILRAFALDGFLIAILAGLAGTPVGSRNFAIVFVWIGWWALLILLMVPLFGRGWCSICPIPMPGEWFQQGALLGPQGALRKPQGNGPGLGRRWPKRLRNIWLQNLGFALVALFSPVILTSPLVSAVVLAAFLLIALAAALVFERRAFCRYLCPVGGFIGLYAQLAPVELRVKDSAVCAAHTEKTCYQGGADGYGCPWNVFPPGLVKNTNCGTCMECLRTCPHDNLALNLRRLGSDLAVSSGRKPDEAFKAFIMLGAALIYSAVLLGPWGGLKAAAYNVGSLPWLGYAVLFLGTLIGVVPGLFWLGTAAGRRLAQTGLPPAKAFTHFAYALAPLGLAAWVAFSLAFVFTNLSYLWPALSDPFGWGWDLFGTASLAWTPYLTRWMPPVQAVVLLAGLAWSARTALRISAQLSPQAGTAVVRRQALPVIGYCLLATAVLLKLLVA